MPKCTKAAQRREFAAVRKPDGRDCMGNPVWYVPGSYNGAVGLNSLTPTRRRVKVPEVRR